MVISGEMAVYQEALRTQEPHPTHPITEMLEIGSPPSRIVANQFGSISKMVSIKPCRQRGVGVTSHRLALTCPGIENLYRLVGIGIILCYPPHHGTLIGCCCITVGHGVVVWIGFPDSTSSAHHLLHGIGNPIERGVRTCLQLIERRLPRVTSLLYHLTGPQQLLFRIEYTGMNKLRHSSCCNECDGY